MKFIVLKMGLIAGLALSVHGCSGDQQQEEAIENTEGENEAGGNQAAEGSGSGNEEGNEEGNAPAEGGDDEASGGEDGEGGEGGEGGDDEATGDESAEGGEAPTTDAAPEAPATDTAATEAPAADATAAAAPTAAPADAAAPGGAAPAAAPPADGTGVDPNRVVRFVVADGTAIKSAANDGAGAAGTFSQGDIVMVVIEGEWAKLNDQAFVKVSDLSPKAVPRMKGKTASWSAAGG